MVATTKRFDELLAAAIEVEASALLLAAGQLPRLRVPRAGGKLQAHGEQPLTAAEMAELARVLFGERRLERQAREGSVTFTFEVEGWAARATLASTRGEYSVGVRLRKQKALTLEMVNAPPVVQELLDRSHGLVVMAGPTGSGKTTTLYAMVEWLNANKPIHVCTVEDPIEYELEPKLALLQQREVGTDVPDMATGIAAAMEQDLDALMIGGLADLESLSAALHAAQTGHLVLIQMHADNARNALERIVEAAPDSMHAMIRRSLSETLVGVVAQRLARRAEKGRVAVQEVLVADDRLREAIFNGDPLSGVPSGEGSVSLVDELAKLEAARKITAEEAERTRRSHGA